MNSKVTMVLRILLGLVLIIFGANKFYSFMPVPEGLPEGATNSMGALMATGYMFKFIGATEVFVGLLLLINKWVPLALVILTPVAINIVLFHLFLAPGGGTIPGLVILILNIVLIYANWNKFKSLF